MNTEIKVWPERGGLIMKKILAVAVLLVLTMGLLSACSGSTSALVRTWTANVTLDGGETVDLDLTFDAEGKYTFGVRGDENAKTGTYSVDSDLLLLDGYAVTYAVKGSELQLTLTGINGEQSEAAFVIERTGHWVCSACGHEVEAADKPASCAECDNPDGKLELLSIYYRYGIKDSGTTYAASHNGTGDGQPETYMATDEFAGKTLKSVYSTMTFTFKAAK